MTEDFIKNLRKKLSLPKKRNTLVFKLNVNKFSLTSSSEDNNLVYSSNLDSNLEKIERIIQNEKGKIVLSGSKAYVYTVDGEGCWSVLSPLFSSNEVQEVFIRGYTIFATINNRRYRVIVDGFNPEKFMSRTAVRSRSRISYRNPETEAELGGWRLYFKLPIISGEWELTATRMIDVPKLTTLIDSLLATRLISLIFKPSTMVIVGPAGSGKTTFLNSFINKIVEIFPLLKISVIEQVRELNIKGGIVNYSSANIRKVTTLLRQSIRYERPDILIVGELRSEEIGSWIDVGRNGVATITTFHSPSLSIALSSMNYFLERDARETRIENVVDIFIVCRKYFSQDGTIRRGVEEAYLNKNGKFYPLYLDGFNLSEDIFMRIVPRKTMLGRFDSIYSLLKEMLLNNQEIRYKRFDPIFLEDILRF